MPYNWWDPGDPASAEQIAATGASTRRLPVVVLSDGTELGAPGSRALADAVGLIGGGNSAGQAATLCANYADEVTLLVRGPSLAASMSSYLVHQLESKANITVQLHAEVLACHGGQSLQALTLRDRTSRAEQDVDTDGLFLFIGAVAETSWLPDTVQRDRLGFFVHRHARTRR